MANTAEQIKVTLVKSLIGTPKKVEVVAKALGLSKTGRTKLHFNTPIIQGMLNKVSHLVTVEKA